MKQRNMWYGVGLVLVLFVVLAILNFIFHIRGGPPREWVENSFAGTVVSVSTSSITVSDASHVERVFTLMPDTKIRKGPGALTPDQLVVGALVLIHAPPGPRGTSSAQEIRILSTDTLDDVRLPRN